MMTRGRGFVGEGLDWLQRQTEVTRDASQLQVHMAGTYHSLRFGMCVIAAALPLVLLLGGRVSDSEPLLCFMSAYYHDPLLRDVFVGALVAIGSLLFLYKGFSPQENWALNAAGALVVGLAFVPTGADCDDGKSALTWHGGLAIGFFACIAYVCIFRASETLSLIGDQARPKRLGVHYKLIGYAMPGLPVVAAVLAFSCVRRPCFLRNRLPCGLSQRIGF